MRRIVGTLIVLFMALALIVPPAAAQSNAPRMNVAFERFTDDPSLPNGRIVPETGVAKVQLEGALNVNMYNRASTCSTPVRLEFNVLGPSYAAAVASPSAVNLVIPGSSGSTNPSTWVSYPFSTVLEISVGREAPAFMDGLYQVTMQAIGQPDAQGTSSSCWLGESAMTSATYRLKNDFTPRTNLEVPELFAKAGPNEKVVFPLTINNVGNGPARISVNLQASATDAFQALSAGPPLRVGTVQSGGNSQTILVEVTTPVSWGYTNEISTLTATITTQYDGVSPGGTESETTEVTFTVQTQGVYAAVFGIPQIIGIPLILLLLLAAGGFGGKGLDVLLARRRERLENEGLEAVELSAPDSVDLTPMRCPKCQEIAMVPRGATPDACASCGFAGPLRRRSPA